MIKSIRVEKAFIQDESGSCHPDGTVEAVDPRERKRIDRERSNRSNLKRRREWRKKEEKRKDVETKKNVLFTGTGIQDCSHFSEIKHCLGARGSGQNHIWSKGFEFGPLKCDATSGLFQSRHSSQSNNSGTQFFGCAFSLCLCKQNKKEESARSSKAINHKRCSLRWL